MKLLWNVKLYTTGGMEKPYRVRIEGNPTGGITTPWIRCAGKGVDPQTALLDAMQPLTPAQKDDLGRFMGPQ